MANVTGTNGNDTLSGTEESDTINALLGRDIVDGLGGSDTLIVDYSSASVDPYAGASPANVPSIVTSSGGSFGGAVKTVDGGNYVTFSNIEHLQVKLDFWHNTFILDGGALALGATVVLDGGSGTDTLEANLTALAGVTLEVGAGGTTASFGTIISFEAFRLTLTEGADTVTTGAGNDTLTGNGGDDVLNSGGGSDILSGGAGSNILNAGDGDDSITSSGIDTVDGGSGGFNFDRWTGDYGSSTANLVFTRDRAAGTGTLSNGTTLTGIEQVMSLTTGSGDDLITFTESEGGIIAAGPGEDRLNLTGYSYTGQISADGSGAFAGNLGNDRFSGIEHLNFTSVIPFGTGSDSIAVDAAPLLAGATLSLDAGGGDDSLDIDLRTFGGISFDASGGGTVVTDVPATLSSFEIFRIRSGGGEDDIVTTWGDDVIDSGGGDDSIYTAGGNDLIDGGAGADAMAGGTGNDIYILDVAGDTVAENAGEGSDEIRTGMTNFSLAVAANVEKLTGTAAGGQTLTGNELDNLITAGAGNDVIDGGLGADAMWGGAGSDIYHVDNVGDSVVEFAGGFDRVLASASWTLTTGAQVEMLTTNDNYATAAIDLTGNALAQYIYGNAGANVLDGNGGGDVMHGFEGDDRFFVRHPFDRVVELAGGGFDRVFAAASFTLEAGSEVEMLTTTDNLDTNAINLTGNELAQYLYGNAGANQLNGGGGGDVMYGFEGNDRFFIRNSADRVVELAGGGTNDRVLAGTSFVLEAGSQVEMLTTDNNLSTGAIDLTGNALAQYLYGNAGANSLDGGGGGDVMYGFGGDDRFFTRDSADRVVEAAGGGLDRVLAGASFTLEAGSEVELLTTDDNLGMSAIDLIGNAIGQYLYGNAGANTLDGKAGADVMTGLGGADTFAFTSSLGGGNVDRIGDFVAADDTIRLDDAIFTGLALGALDANAFVIGSQAADADDRIVYDQTTGALLFDADGNGAGAAVQFATLDGAPIIAANDFLVI